MKEHTAHSSTLTPRTLTQLHTCGVVYEPMCSLGGYQYNQLFTKPVRISATASPRCPLIWLMSLYTCTNTIQRSKPLKRDIIRVSYRNFSWGVGGEEVDACKGCIHASVHPLDFNEILDIFKDKNHQIQL